MNVTEFEQRHSVKLILKSESRLMRAIGFVLKPFTPTFMTDFWTTMRLPFSKTMIAYPSSVTDPLSKRNESIVEHEIIHAKDMSSAWGLFKMAFLVSIFPLPILFSGRWFIEFPAYLNDITKP